jgi:hypothetical protein
MIRTCGGLNTCLFNCILHVQSGVDPEDHGGCSDPSSEGGEFEDSRCSEKLMVNLKARKYRWMQSQVGSGGI